MERKFEAETLAFRRNMRDQIMILGRIEFHRAIRNALRNGEEHNSADAHALHRFDIFGDTFARHVAAHDMIPCPRARFCGRIGELRPQRIEIARRGRHAWYWRGKHNRADQSHH